jgi:1,4-alpha-glucan branching enzyme
MIRLVTFALGGEGYLKLHGQRVRAPRVDRLSRRGNNFSYQYARRQWSLVDDPALRYRDLDAFDREMQNLDEKYNLLAEPLIELIQVHEDHKMLVFRRGAMVFIFNFHPHHSQSGYRFGVPEPANYRLVLNTDEFWFGGHGLVNTGQVYPRQTIPADGRKQSVQIYIPCRTAQILMPVGL